jgi:16S rRNA C967 or C1407 C5-methylase (RsmB/RsmF family)
MQREILASAHRMLVPGGHIVYSTCTFGTSENEDMIDWFLETYPEYDVVPHPENEGRLLFARKEFRRIHADLASDQQGGRSFLCSSEKEDDAELFFAEPPKEKKRKPTPRSSIQRGQPPKLFFPSMMAY